MQGHIIEGAKLHLAFHVVNQVSFNGHYDTAYRFRYLGLREQRLEWETLLAGQGQNVADNSRPCKCAMIVQLPKFRGMAKSGTLPAVALTLLITVMGRL